jgi:hypothetical protein
LPNSLTAAIKRLETDPEANDQVIGRMEQLTAAVPSVNMLSIHTQIFSMINPIFPLHQL